MKPTQIAAVLMAGVAAAATTLSEVTIEGNGKILCKEKKRDDKEKKLLANRIVV